MKKIIVCTDFSACSDNAMRYAIRLTKGSRVQLEFLHVIRSFKNVMESIRKLPAEFERVEEEEVAKLSKHVRSQYKRLGIRPGKYTCKVRFGAEFQSLLYEVIAEDKVDLIVLGTHGASGLREKIFGTHAAGVISASPVPVLAIPAAARYTEIKELTCFTDLVQIDEELKQLRLVARALRATLDLIHFDYGWARGTDETKAIKRLTKGHYHLKNIRASIDTPLLTLIKKYHLRRDSLICLFHDKKSALGKFLTGSSSEEASMKLHSPLLSFQRG
jgi:nucleotide-binding universal stress UspA family protein